MVYTIRKPAIDRLMAKVSEDGDCWVWSGATTGAKDYGIISLPPDSPHSSRLVHRISYEFFVGEIPDGLTIDHSCENKRCVNPAHLDPVPPGVNTHRRFERRTHCARGHELGGQNTMVGTVAKCRQCHNLNGKAGYHRRKAEA